MSDDGDTVLRVRRSANYTAPLDAVTGREAADRELSWKAVGLLTYLVTRPDGWKFFKADLISRHSDGKTAVESGLRELREAGFLEMHQRRLEDGTFRTDWTVSDRPLTEEDDDRTGKSGPDRTGFSEGGLSGGGKPGDRVVVEEGGGEEGGRGSSLRSSPPGEPGERESEDEFDALAWYRETPDGEKPPTQHWNRGITALWQPTDEQIQAQGGWPACSRYLKRLAEDYGASWGEVSAFVVGSRLLVDAGEVGGVEPGVSFFYALPQDSETWDGATWWSRAREAFRKWRDARSEPDADLEGMFDGVAEVAHAG